jgi:hypothetical protein
MPWDLANAITVFTGSRFFATCSSEMPYSGRTAFFDKKKGTLVDRYLNVTFPFLLSGIVHTVLDVCGGVPRSEARTWVYFVLQAFGIMVEDTIEAAYRAMFTCKNGEKLKLLFWHKMVGYLWVFLFQVWATSAWTYANVRHQDPVNNHILPFSVVGWAKNKMSS